MNNLPENYFADYESYSDDNIAEITSKGISLKNDTFIDFSVCAENFKKANPTSSGTCIGEREVTDMSFTFYTNQKPIMIIFEPRNKFFEFLTANGKVKRFHSLQLKINDFGYSTLDMS